MLLYPTLGSCPTFYQGLDMPHSVWKASKPEKLRRQSCLLARLSSRQCDCLVLFAAFHAKDDTISEVDIKFNLSDTSMSYDLSLRNPQRERDQILEAYKRGGNWKQAAKLLNITEKTLISLRKKYGIDSNGEIQS